LVKANGVKHVLCINYMKLMVKDLSWHMSYYGSHLGFGYTYFTFADVFYLGVGVILYLAICANAYLFLHFLLFFNTVLPERPMRGMKKYSLK